jgi:hypothetical protein
VFIYAIMPRKYQIYSDKIRIVCSIIKINILLENIERIELRPASNAYASMEGMRFATGTGQKCLLLVKNRGINIVIQPMDTEKFLKYLRETSSVAIINN